MQEEIEKEHREALKARGLFRSGWIGRTSRALRAIGSRSSAPPGKRRTAGAPRHSEGEMTDKTRYKAWRSGPDAELHVIVYDGAELPLGHLEPRAMAWVKGG